MNLDWLRRKWAAEVQASAEVLAICPSCGQMTRRGDCQWCGKPVPAEAQAADAEAIRKQYSDRHRFETVRRRVRLAPLYSALQGLTKWNPSEQMVLVASLVKWIALGSVVGIAAGSASALFLWSLELVTRTRMAHLQLIWFLPVAGLLVGWVYSRFGKDVAGGNNLILTELHQGGGQVPLKMAPFVLGGTLVTHLFGGSAGREGTAVQMGGSLADSLARLLRLSPADRRILLTSGVAGGFGSVFGTPLAGTVFGLEVTQVGGLRYESLVAAFAAGIVGDLVTRGWGITHAAYPTLAGMELSPALLGKLAAIGLASGLAARLFAELEHGFKAAFKTVVPWEPLRPLVGGILVAGAIWGFGGLDYAGLGSPMIMRSFTAQAVPNLAFLWKLILTALTLGAGFQGGEVTPLFFIGATLGSVAGHLIGVPVALAAAAGFVAVFAGAANTPLACIIMGAELFGGAGLPYLAMATVVSYIASGHAGIYTAQRVAVPKSKSLPVPDKATLGALHQARAPMLPELRTQDDWAGEEASNN